MRWFSAPGYWLARLLFLRVLAGIYLIAFMVAVTQFRPLLNDNGLLPVWLMLSGNFSWLNVLTIALALLSFDDGFLTRFVPVSRPHLMPSPAWFQIVAVAVAVLVSC
ncbi:MAG: hypothetical protein ACR2HY_06800 [Acidimicrobiales bacterium]